MLVLEVGIDWGVACTTMFDSILWGCKWHEKYKCLPWSVLFIVFIEQAIISVYQCLYAVDLNLYVCNRQEHRRERQMTVYSLIFASFICYINIMWIRLT